MQTEKRIKEKIKELQEKRKEAVADGFNNIAMQYEMTILHLEWVVEV